MDCDNSSIDLPIRDNPPAAAANKQKIAIFAIVMLRKTEAIVLRSMKYGENKLIIDLLTETDGVVSVAVNMPKTSRGKLKRQLFQPLTLLNVELDLRPKLSLQHLRDARLSEPFRTIPFDSAKLGIALFLAEFLCHCSQGVQPDDAFFAYVRTSILWLDNTDSGFANFHLVFMMRLSRFIGFLPNVDDYRKGYVFDLRSATFSPSAPLYTEFLSPAESEQVVGLMRMNYENMHLFRLSREERNRILDLIITYYRLHVASFPELRSLEVVRALWA